MSYAFETKLATKFYSEGPRPRGIKFIVIHWWGDSMNLSFDGIRDYLASPDKASQVSAHYVAQGADADGTVNPRVAQIVMDDDIAWQAGNWPANEESIGIECRPNATDADYNTIAELIRNLRAKHGDLPLRAHKEFASTACPGVYDLTRLDTLARKGTGTVAACTRATWRGVIVCAHMVPKLNVWAESVGAGILLKPLAGCGSYQTTTAASAGTHAGGGAIDIDLRYVASDQRKWVADKGRLAGLQVAWHRDAITGVWTWHCHSLDPSCPNLAKQAVSQIVEFSNGGDGLVGTKPDGNTRSNVEQLVAIFKSRLISVVGDITADAQVRLLQQAVYQTVDGIWGEQTDIDLRNTGAEATRNYSGVFYKSWSLDQRKRMQRSWGVAQNGNWDSTTQAGAKATVKKIQSGLGVPADSIWGPMTSTAYYALRSKKYTGNTSPVFPSPHVTVTPTPPVVVKPPAPVLTDDQKIKELQRGVRAVQDGVWGEQTDIALRNVMAEISAGNNGTFYKTWSLAQRQAMDKSIGQPQDGVYTTSKRTAFRLVVNHIQKTIGVPMTGVVDTATKNAYFALRNKYYKGSYPTGRFPVPYVKPVDYNYPYQNSAGWYPYPGKQGASYYGPSSVGNPWYSGRVAGGTNSGTNASGTLTLTWIQGHIKRIQRCVGAGADGLYGTATVAAVKKWQGSKGITADGIVGPKTWAAMAKSKDQGK